MIEATVVKARTAPETGANDNVIVVSERSKPNGFSWTKDGYHGNSESRGDMHWAAIVANKQLASFQHRHEFAEWQR